MRTKKFLFCTLLFIGLISQNAYSQSMQLTIGQIDSFPSLPNDTAFEGQFYNFTIAVYNLDNNQFTTSDTLKIYITNDSSQATVLIADTIYPVFQGLDTINIPVNNYQFSSPFYKTGNNIVVVWPRVGNIISTTNDSLFLDVYFEPLTSVNMLSVQNEIFSVFPNPVSDKITINLEIGKFIEYVRILNDLGQEIRLLKTVGKQVDVRFLTEGFYFIEIKERNGTITRKKFLKL